MVKIKSKGINVIRFEDRALVSYGNGVDFVMQIKEGTPLGAAIAIAKHRRFGVLAARILTN
jgi:hypothetical protein